MMRRRSPLYDEFNNVRTNLEDSYFSKFESISLLRELLIQFKTAYRFNSNHGHQRFRSLFRHSFQRSPGLGLSRRPRFFLSRPKIHPCDRSGHRKPQVSRQETGFLALLLGVEQVCAQNRHPPRAFRDAVVGAGEPSGHKSGLGGANRGGNRESGGVIGSETGEGAGSGEESAVQPEEFCGGDSGD